MDAFELGVIEAMEKIAKSGLRPGAIAGIMGEGKLTSSLASKFRMSPGEMNKASKILKKQKRKAAVAKETVHRTAASRFFPKKPEVTNSMTPDPSAARRAALTRSARMAKGKTNPGSSATKSLMDML